MPVTITEKFDSRLITTGQDPSVELRYTVRGTNDSDVARATVESGSLLQYDVYSDGAVVLPRHTVTVEPIGDELWEGVARYGIVPQTHESVFSFDTGGGTHHVTQSRQTVGSYAPPGATAPNFKGAIGVTADSVEGVDITVPVYHFSETHYLPDAAIADTYGAVLFGLTGKVNNATFRGFAAGECLFLGASGSKRGYGDWEISYRFAASPNAVDLVIGDITGIAKKGWEYLWIRYADVEDTDAHVLVKRPIAVYVEKVYEEGDFSALGIGV